MTDMMHASDKGIPQDLMNRSQCVVVVPNLKKAAFIVGAKYGRGFAMCRQAERNRLDGSGGDPDRRRKLRFADSAEPSRTSSCWS